MQVLSLIPFDEAYRARLRGLAEGRCRVTFGTSDLSREEYIAHLRTADVILGDPEAGDLKYCEHLKWLQTTWAGVDQYVRCGHLRQGMLCNMTGGYGPVIGEILAAGILSQLYRFGEYRQYQRQSHWHSPLPVATLEEATVLILGAGDIGTELARRLRPFGCRIVGVRRVVREYPDVFDDMITLEELNQWLPKADVVACSLPHTPATQGLLDYEMLGKMKKTAILANVGRGGLIVTGDLLRRLEEGWFSGVYLDVTDPEPLPEDHPLWREPRVLITPHVAGNGYGPGSPTERRIWDIVLDNLDRYLDGKPCRNVVDFSTGYRVI